MAGPLCRDEAGCATPAEVQPAVTSSSAAAVRSLTGTAGRCEVSAMRESYARRC